MSIFDPKLLTSDHNPSLLNLQIFFYLECMHLAGLERCPGFGQNVHHLIP